MSTTYETFDARTTPFQRSLKRPRWRIWSFGEALAGRMRTGRRKAPKAVHFHPDARLLNDMEKDAPIGEIRDCGPGTLLENEIRRLR